MSGFQDLGGSQYRLRAVDEFSTIFKRLRDEMAKTQEQFAQLQGTLGSTSGTNAGTARVQAAQAENAAVQALNASITRRAAAERSAAAQQNRDDRQRLLGIQAEVKQQQQNEALRARIFKAEKAAAAERISAQAQASKGAGFFNALLGDANGQGQKLLFTFRRLVGVLAIFQGARAIAGGIADAVKASINLNAQLETVQVAITGTLAQLGQFTTLSGEIAKGPEAIALASTLASEQLQKLRVDAARIGVDFGTLAQNFQIALGQAIPAGLRPDEIRRFTVLVSQAAQKVGVDQAQLAEEIRSLLIPGAATARSSRIFTTFGFTRDQIENARAQGNLLQLFEKRLGVLSTVGDAASSTFARLSAQVKAFGTQLLTGVSETFFFDLKGLLVSILGLLGKVSTSAEGAFAGFVPNPGLEAGLKAIFSVLDSLVNRASAFTKGLDNASIQRAIEGFVPALNLAADLLVSMLKSVASIAETFSVLVGAVAPFLSLLSGVLGFLTQAKVSALVFSAVVSGLGKLFGPTIAAVELLGTAVLNTARKYGILGAAAREAALAAEAAAIASTGAQAGAAAGVAGASGGVFAKLATFLGAGSVLGRAVGLFGRFIAGPIPAIILTIGSFIPGFFDKIGSVVGGITGFVSDVFKSVINAVAGVPSKVASAVSLATTAELNALTEANTSELDRKIQDFAKANNVRPAEAAKVILEDAIRDIREIQEKIQDLILDNAKPSLIAELTDHLRAITQAVSRVETRFGFQKKPIEVDQKEKDAAAAALDSAKASDREAISQGKILDLKLQQKNEDSIALAQSQDQIRLIDQQITALERQNAEKAKAFELANRENIAGRNGPEAQALAESQKAALLFEIDASERVLANKKKQAQIDAKRQQDILTGSAGAGFVQGLKDFGEKFASEFSSGLRIATEAVNQFADFVSSTIVDAFDPSNDTSIKQRIAQFMQGLARTILQEAVKLGIAKILVAVGISAAGASSGGSVGVAQGGQVRGMAGGGNVTPVPSPQHFGLAGKRPKGLHHSDTVPVWLALKEFVEPVHAVNRYGADLFEAFRQGRIDVGMARGLLEGRSFMPKVVRSRGMASGGVIGASNTIIPSSLDSGSTVAVLPVLVTGRQDLDRMVNSDGGRAALDSRDRRNTTLNAALGQTRRR